MILLLQIAVIVAVARVARWLVRPIGQPAVIGEMIAGVLLGPSLFGWLMPRASVVLFPPETLTVLNALSQAGLVVFMFLVGLSVDFHHVHTRRRAAVVTSGTSIVVPFLLGVVLASATYDRLAPPGIGELPFALFIGVAMSITAFPVLARILRDRHLLATELGVIAITCAAFDDVSGWLILGGIMTIVRGGAATLIAVRVTLLSAYVVIMIGIVRPALGRMAQRNGRSFGLRGADVVIVAITMGASAAATALLGVHLLFGAFFAGLIMPRGTHIDRLVATRIEPVLTSILLPLFFAYTGLHTSVQLLDTPALWWDAALILMVAVAGKGGASLLAARAMGVAWREAAALGILLNTRGLIELVVLTVGLDLGILSPVVFSMFVLMALTTTFMTTPLVAWLLPGPRLDEAMETSTRR